MDISGEFAIPASREQVWRALNDPEVLKACIPGCQEIEKASDTEFSARLVIKIGPVKVPFKGKVTLSDLDPPNGYKIAGEGQGTAGFARGEATVRLKDDGGATVLAYQAQANVGGKLAQVGSRLLDATANKLAGEFFGKFSELVGAPVEEAAEEAAAEAAEEPAPAAREGLSLWVWVVGVLVAVTALLLIFSR